MNASIFEPNLAGRETLLRLDAGSTLFREGEEPAGVYIVRSGVVKLLFSSRTGSAKALREATAGQILGLTCIVTSHPHDCTATAAGPCEIAFIERKELLRALADSPAMWFNVLHMLSREVSAVYGDVRALAAGR